MAHRVTLNDNDWYNEWQRDDNNNKMTISNSEWENEWIRMRVSIIEWFYVSKETKGQSGRPINLLNNFIQFSMQYTLGAETLAGRNFCGFCDFCQFLRRFLPSKIVKRKIAKGFSSENKNFSENVFQKVLSTIQKSETKDLQGTKVQDSEDNVLFMI